MSSPIRKITMVRVREELIMRGKKRTIVNLNLIYNEVLYEFI